MAQRVDCNISGQHKNTNRTKKTREHLLDRSENSRTVKKKKKEKGNDKWLQIGRQKMRVPKTC